jgi:tripartite-type tricarboxylate transporter receptor subunit TctC
LHDPKRSRWAMHWARRYATHGPRLVPNVLVVNPKTGFKTEADLRKFAKAKPGKLNFGSAGSGASRHLAGNPITAAA